MTLSRLLLTTSLCAVVSFPAFAQQRSFNAIDTDQDGSLSAAELEAAFGAEGAARVLLRADRDGSNSLSVGEIRGRSGDDENDDENDDDEDDDDEDDDESDDDESDDNESSDDEDDDDDSDESDDDSSDESDESDDD